MHKIKKAYSWQKEIKSLNETILFIKNNYLKIYEEMKLNNLPTKDQFLISFRDIISKYNKMENHINIDIKNRELFKKKIY